MALGTGVEAESLTLPTSVPVLPCALDWLAPIISASATAPPTSALETDREQFDSTNGISPPEFVSGTGGEHHAAQSP
jgi:hypothetical protein